MAEHRGRSRSNLERVRPCAADIWPKLCPLDLWGRSKPKAAPGGGSAHPRAPPPRTASADAPWTAPPTPPPIEKGLRRRLRRQRAPKPDMHARPPDLAPACHGKLGPLTAPAWPKSPRGTHTMLAGAPPLPAHAPVRALLRATAVAPCVGRGLDLAGQLLDRWPEHELDGLGPRAQGGRAAARTGRRGRGGRGRRGEGGNKGTVETQEKRKQGIAII